MPNFDAKATSVDRDPAVAAPFTLAVVNRLVGDVRREVKAPRPAAS
jgi:hypothetical protein